MHSAAVLLLDYGLTIPIEVSKQNFALTKRLVQLLGMSCQLLSKTHQFIKDMPTHQRHANSCLQIARGPSIAELAVTTIFNINND